MTSPSTLLVSRKEREEIAKNCVYKEVRGNRIVDLDKAIVIMRKYRKEAGLSPIVEIRQKETFAKGKYHKSFSFIRDIDFNLDYGFINSIDEKQNVSWQRIGMDELIKLNLDITKNAKMWVVLRMYHLIEGSPMSSNMIKLYHVYDHSIENKKIINRSNDIVQSINYISKLGGREMVMLARYFGLSGELQEESSTTVEVVHGKLLQLAHMNPTDFMRKVLISDRVYYQYLESGLNYGVVTHTDEGGYMFKDIYLGLTKDDVVHKMKNDKIVTQGLIQETNDKDSLADKIDEESKLEKASTEKTKNDSTDDTDPF